MSIDKVAQLYRESIELEVLTFGSQLSGPRSARLLRNQEVLGSIHGVVALAKCPILGQNVCPVLSSGQWLFNSDIGLMFSDLHNTQLLSPDSYYI